MSDNLGDAAFTPEEWQHMEALDRRFDPIERGVLAEVWMGIGEIFLAIQVKSMFLAETNQPFGRRYTSTQKQLANEVRQRLPAIAKINNTDISAAVWCARHRERIAQWVGGIKDSGYRYAGLTHPRAIKRRFLANNIVKDEDKKPEKEKKPSRKQTYEQETYDLGRLIDDLRQELAAKELENDELRAENGALITKIKELTPKPEPRKRLSSRSRK